MKQTMKTPPVGIRIAPDLKDWLTKKAQASHRSLNGEVTVAIEEYKARHEKEAANARTT